MNLDFWWFLAGAVAGSFLDYGVSHWKKWKKSDREDRVDADFKTIFQNFILDAIGKVQMTSLSAHYPFGWNDELARLLLLAVEANIISRMNVCQLLDREIRREGRLCFEQHVERGTYQDHTFWLAAFAYALQCGEFSEEEIGKIHFDHDQTVEIFVKEYGEPELLEKAFQRLLPNK